MLTILPGGLGTEVVCAEEIEHVNNNIAPQVAIKFIDESFSEISRLLPNTPAWTKSVATFQARRTLVTDFSVAFSLFCSSYLASGRRQQKEKSRIELSFSGLCGPMPRKPPIPEKSAQSTRSTAEFSAPFVWTAEPASGIWASVFT
jgi:hypothetical protein